MRRHLMDGSSVEISTSNLFLFITTTGWIPEYEKSYHYFGIK